MKSEMQVTAFLLGEAEVYKSTYTIFFCSKIKCNLAWKQYTQHVCLWTFLYTFVRQKHATNGSFMTKQLYDFKLGKGNIQFFLGLTILVWLCLSYYHSKWLIDCAHLWLCCTTTGKPYIPPLVSFTGRKAFRKAVQYSSKTNHVNMLQSIPQYLPVRKRSNSCVCMVMQFCHVRMVHLVWHFITENESYFDKTCFHTNFDWCKPVNTRGS